MTNLKQKAGSQADSEEDLHELRLSIKRLRAFCQLVRPLRPEPAARLIIHLKSVARAVSANRDRQAIATWLKAHPKAGAGIPVPKNAGSKTARARQRLEVARAEVLSRRKEVDALARSCERRVSRQIVARTYRRACEAWSIALRNKRPADFHRARRRLKDLQYQLEILEKSPRLALNRAPNRFRERLRDLATALGDAHDALIVEDHAKDLDLATAKIARVRKERVKLERSALQLARKLHLLRDLQPRI